MALIKCPECDKDISEYAIKCGYCFYPLKEKSIDTAASVPKLSRIRNGKPSRNGNGTESITHIKGNLRKHFRVRCLRMIRRVRMSKPKYQEAYMKGGVFNG